ncbi:hypothetical protein D3870_04735 [Noviherbaspirillum cavernae]|uniref:DUF6745 domain-containing protein n=2 Tax=Noviherbaspirillum cavernae TaxID=2320862 RepID=A0A418WYV5_9BURK|nr:hypothetical protein D3870_04735 [Noviherbaspirillum cavernae]
MARKAVSTLDFSRLRQAWVRIGLTTQPAERDAAEAAVRKAYQAAGLAVPEKVVWCESPFSQALVRAIVLDPHFADGVVSSMWVNVKKTNGPGIRDDIKDAFCSSMRLFDTGAVKQRLINAIKNDVTAGMYEHMLGTMNESVRFSATDSVWQSIWHSVWESTEDCILTAIGDGIRAAVKAQDKQVLEDTIRSRLTACIGDSVKTTVWDGVMENAWANIRSGADSKARVSAWKNLWEVLQKPIWENIASPIGEHVKTCASGSAQASGYGQHDAYWLSFYAYFREVEGLEEETEQITGLLDLAKTAGWFTPHARVCWVSERPRTLSLNDKGKLHSSDGPALTYPDGWQVYATDGALRFSSVPQ